jgi:prepilin-type N-terminal cleavage/methylation domain-containing protein/prepilin-type processing-associated H-X9-DG protein
METKSKINRGFTLIELLVVISIIALLLSILLPSLRKVRQQTRTLLCSTLLKDITSAIFLYSNDFASGIPPSFPISMEESDAARNTKWDPIWIARVAPYYQKIGDFSQDFFSTPYSTPYFRCPTQEYYLNLILESVRNRQERVTSPKTGMQFKIYPAGGTFAMNWYFSGYGALGGDDSYNVRKFSQVRNCPKVPMLSDAAAEPYYEFNGQFSWDRASFGGWFMRPLNPHPSASQYGWEGGYDVYGPAPVHQGKINYAFCDGHVETRRMWPWDDNTHINRGDYLYLFHPLGIK